MHKQVQLLSHVGVPVILGASSPGFTQCVPRPAARKALQESKQSYKQWHWLNSRQTHKLSRLP